MTPLKIALVKKLTKLWTTTVVLSDEREERALPFWYHNLQIELSTIIHDPLIEAGRKVIGEPFAIDFLLKLIQELGGSIERIEIDALQGDITYARLHMRGRDGKPALVNTRLDDALSLALRLETPLAINDELWQHLSVSLTEKEANRELQFEAVAAMAQHTSIRPLASPITSQQPRNLDFRDGLKGWQARGLPLWEKRFDLQLDPEVTYQGRPVLRAVLQGEDGTNQESILRNVISLSHEGFLADTYRGKRMRLVTYCQVREAKEAYFEIVVTSPPLQPDSEHYQLLITRTPLLEETADWQRQELVVDVPQNASVIMLKLHMADQGTFWISAIQWEPVDQSVPLTQFYHTLPLADLQNLDFQHGLDGWFSRSGNPRDYTYGTESVDGKGTHCMYIKAIREEPRSLMRLQQSIKADNYLGKRVRLRGSLKGNGLLKPARLYMRKGAIQGYVEHCIVGTQDWTACEIATFLHEEASQLEIGLLLNGKGQVWLKDLAFEVVG
ncbi:hypothetical protein KSF_101680 [Reticulibacter mediterranei]|uniref:BFN domain-containing protein n=1 Tax=Reticulibacter mediterranei TaxID=2778369 RepID=A0A8J3N919_9CHLR|nr:bifunctional nuclease domain-containing protein [Reticulibacter mediterranei]GHP00121.1 hypothetical protein KSF_101680 [Reticulibacter mediterranei]